METKLPVTAGLKVACLGAGYVGVPTSAILAEQCKDIKVVVLDVNKQRIEGFNKTDQQAKFPIFEPGLEELVEQVRGKSLFFSTDVEGHLADADIVFVAVNTPTKVRGIGAGAATDLAAWESAGRSIAKFCRKPDVVVVEKSTVPVKTAQRLNTVLQTNPHGTHFEVISNPEFLAEGTAVTNIRYPDRVLIGGETKTAAGQRAIQLLFSLYAQWVPEEKILTIDTWSSELAKLAANSFLAQRISSINSIARICENTGANVAEVSAAIGMDSRIGSKFLTPSVGFGGSCFKKDIFSLVYICRRLSLFDVADYWESVIQLNENSKSLFAETIIHTMFSTVYSKRIAIFGFAFKKNTSDVRETPAAYVCSLLLEEGAELAVWDPMVSRESSIHEMIQEGLWKSEYESRFLFEDSAAEAVKNSHAIAIMTEWDEFVNYDYESFYKSMVKPAYLFDGRLLMDSVKLTQIGFHVTCIGRRQESLLGAAAESYKASMTRFKRQISSEEEETTNCSRGGQAPSEPEEADPSN